MAPSASQMVPVLVLVFVPSIFASCPAGEGYPSAMSTTCQTCSEGTWSGEGSTECTRCPPGTYNGQRGAVDVSMCAKCPRGTWSSQEGSPTVDSCQPCSPGRWGDAEGLGSDSQCTACLPGTWSNQFGATTSAVCTACESGKWSSQAGSPSASSCVDCAPGTWSNVTGASTQKSCTPCKVGTWSTAWGATDESTCTDCEAGLYQPAVGQANQTVCIRCPPGKYGTMMGAETCASCPAGSWNADFAQTECTICPQGKWMHSLGSLRDEDCTSCGGSGDCLPDRSARITIEFRNFPFLELGSAKMMDVKAALANDIASACGVDNETVVDLHGKAEDVSISADGTVSAFVTDVVGTSANELASRLYSATFRGELVNSTLAVLGVSREHFSAGAISVQPEEFVPLIPTSTTTTVSSTSATSTSTGTNTGTVTMDWRTPSNTSFLNSIDLSSGAATPVTNLVWLLLCLGLVVSGM